MQMPHPSNRLIFQTLTTIGLLFVGLMLLWIDPVLANKFETIGGGVSGSSSLKREHVSIIFYVIAGIFLVTGIGSFLVPHNNPFKLDFCNWKQSAIFMIVIGVAALITGSVL